MNTTPAPSTGTGTATAADEAFVALVERLSRQSTERHHDAYADVPWDEPGCEVDAGDPRWELWSFDPLAGTAWYQAQPPEVRARIGMWRVATAMRVGWEFENVLQRGLLAYAYRLPNGSAEFRFVHHEVAEESQHTLMFQELIDRTGLPVRGLPTRMKRLAEVSVIPLSRMFPALFFLFVLGGEEPVDHLQRAQLRAGGGHPLLQRIMRIHVTEEARHVSFARHFLQAEVPKLDWGRRQVMAVVAPFLFGIMARQMLEPAPGMLRKAGVPDDVWAEARRSPAAGRLLRDAVAKPRRLCTQLGLVNPVTRPLWRALGIWDDPAGG